MARRSMTPDEARLAALAAQGFGSSGSRGAGPSSSRAMLAAIRRLGLLQVDSVNVLARAHYLPLFSRLGTYDRSVLDRQSSRAPRRLFEYWGHEASLVPVETEPLLRWRMVEEHAWSGPRRVAEEQPGLVAEVLAAVADRGPVTAAELERLVPMDHARTRDYGWGWNWSDAKRALEYLFGCGAISSAGRDRTFTRRYDLSERVLPDAVRRIPTPTRGAAIRALVAQAARAMAVATESELRDYWRLPAPAARTAVGELTAEGILEPVTIAGWPAAFRHRESRVPRGEVGEALLAPFDPLVWHRARTQRLFGMRYRIEIYVPARRREFGYYVLPFLYQGHLVGRVDLKADRRAGLLAVRGAWSQHAVTGGASHTAPDVFAPALLEHLAAMAVWLGLGGVSVEHERGDLAQLLRRLL